MRKTLAFLCVLAVVAVAGPAWGANITFTDADTNDSNWSTPGNWDLNAVPDPNADNVFIGDGLTCEVNNAGQAGFRLRLGTTGGPGTLEINSGDFFLDRFLHYGCQNAGTIVQNGGTASWPDTDMCWAGGICGAYSARYELHDGTCTWRSNMILWQLDDGSNGVSADIIQTGGLLEVLGTGGDGWYIAFGTHNNSSAEYKISGGALNAGDVFLMGSSADSTNTTASFHVVGSAPTSIALASYTQTIGIGSTGAESVLDLEIDDGGITMINVSGTATFASGASLRVGWESGATPVPGTWTVLTAADIVDNGLVLHGDVNPALWSFQIVDVPMSKAIEVTYVPEPATLVLLGVGLVGVVLRRRRA